MRSAGEQTQVSNGPSTSDKTAFLSQIYGSIVVCLVSLSLGNALGYPTKALPQMRLEQDENVNMDQYEGSFYAAIFWMSGIVSSPMGGILSGWLGRKKVVLLFGPLVACGWLVTALAQGKAMLFLGRAMISSALCLQLPSVNVFIAETVHPKLRSSLVILPAFFMALGMLVVWTLGYFLPWRTTAYILMSPSLLMMVLMMPLPETPFWLIEARRDEEAMKALQFFRGNDYDVTDELTEILDKREQKVKNLRDQSWKFVVRRIFSMAFFKPFSCVGVLYVIGTWTGFNSLIVYMIDILEEAGSNFDPNIGPIIVGGVRLFCAGIIPFFIKKLPPRLLFVSGQTFSSLAMALLGIFVYLRENYPDLPHLSYFAWIPLAVVLINIIMRAAGILPVLHTLMSEVYPTEIRTQATGITQASFLASGAFGVKLFPEMKNALGLHGLCFMYASIGLLNCFWGAYTIPDNRGKSLVKVEEMYEKHDEKVDDNKVVKSV